jgi:hypothetical protein
VPQDSSYLDHAPNSVYVEVQLARTCAILNPLLHNLLFNFHLLETQERRVELVPLLKVSNRVFLHLAASGHELG